MQPRGRQAPALAVRDATGEDIPAIVAITNHAILTTTANWNITPITHEARAAWLAERQGAGLPVLVAEREGGIVGFASYGPFRPYEAYLHTAEHGLYVDTGAQRSGVGTALLGALLARAEAAGVHVMVGAVEAGNTASIGLHERLGFVRVGLMREVGRKFDRWLDLVLMQRILGGSQARGSTEAV